MRQNIEKIKREAEERIDKAQNEKDLKELQIKFLGRRQGEITQILRNMKNLPFEDRPII